jgi:SRSO17 transposase
MDIKEQVCKHLSRTPKSTIPLVDQYFSDYRDLFPHARSYEYFKLLYLGIISNLK